MNLNNHPLIGEVISDLRESEWKYNGETLHAIDAESDVEETPASSTTTVTATAHLSATTPAPEKVFDIDALAIQLNISDLRMPNRLAGGSHSLRRKEGERDTGHAARQTGQGPTYLDEIDRTPKVRTGTDAGASFSFRNCSLFGFKM